MKRLAPLSNAEQAIADRVADGWPHVDSFSAAIAISAVQICAETLLREARRAPHGPYRQGLEDAAALLTGIDADDSVVIPLQRRTSPDGAA